MRDQGADVGQLLSNSAGCSQYRPELIDAFLAHTHTGPTSNPNST
jgi:hypothetical protein